MKFLGRTVLDITDKSYSRFLTYIVPYGTHFTINKDIFCLYSDVKKQSNSHLPNFPKKNTKKTWKFETIFWSCSFCNHQPKPSTWLIFNKENRTFWQKLSAITFFVGLRLQKQFHCSLFISSICLIWVQQSWERNIIN